MSALDTNIISGARVKTITGKASGIEDRKLDPAIHMAQHALEQILGTTLYALVEAASPTFTGDYSTLFTQFIEPFLSYKTIEYAYGDFFAEPDRNGVFKRASGGDFESVTGKELAQLEGIAASRAEVFQSSMLRWLLNLASDNAIRIAYDTNVDLEPRTKRTDNSRVPARPSRWQNQGGSPYFPKRRRHESGTR